MSYEYKVFSTDETHIATIEGDDFNSADGRLAVYLYGEIVAEFVEGTWGYWLRQDLSEDVAAKSAADDKSSHVLQAIKNAPVHWRKPAPWGESLHYAAAPNNAAFNKVDFSQRVELGDDLANQIQDIVRKQFEELRTLFEQGGDSVG